MKKRVLSVILFAVGMLFCSCKFNAIFGGNSSIAINLPFGNSRAGDEVKYSFVVDCFEGAEITETAKYTQKSESGKKILFADVTPGVYTVRVLAYEYNNFENLLYTGQDTKEVFDGLQTTFAIQLKRAGFKGDFDNLNFVYLQYLLDEQKEFTKLVAKTNTQEGVTAVNYDWYIGSVYLKEFSGESKNTISFKDVTDRYPVELYPDIDDETSYYSVIVKFSNGEYSSYSLSMHSTYEMEKYVAQNDLAGYNNFLKSDKTMPKYTKNGNANAGKLNYHFYFDTKEDSEVQFASQLSIYKVENGVTEKPDFVIDGTKGKSYSEEKGIIDYNFDCELTNGYYIIKSSLYMNDPEAPKDAKKGEVLRYLDVVYVENGYTTNAELLDYCLNRVEVPEQDIQLKEGFYEEFYRGEKYNYIIDTYIGWQRITSYPMEGDKLHISGNLDVNDEDLKNFTSKFPLRLEITIIDNDTNEEFYKTLTTTDLSLEYDTEDTIYVVTINNPETVFVNEDILSLQGGNTSGIGQAGQVIMINVPNIELSLKEAVTTDWTVSAAIGSKTLNVTTINGSDKITISGDFSLSSMESKNFNVSTFPSSNPITITINDSGVKTTIAVPSYELVQSGSVYKVNIDNLYCIAAQEISHPTGSNPQYSITSSVSELSSYNDIESGCVYSISTESELNSLATWSKNTNFEYVTFVLTGEIVLSSSFTPIGNSTASPFLGKFDGQGYTISYDKTTSGLFYYVGPTTYNPDWIPIIQNVIVDGNISLSKKDIVGSIVGDVCGPCVIDNCISKVNVENTAEDSGVYIGGICGKVNSLAITEVPVVIKNCINIGNLTGYINIGGIVGHVQTPTDIYNCANYGRITFSNDKAGGIIGGIAFSSGEPNFNNVSNCFNAGEIRNNGGDNDYGAIYGGDRDTYSDQITNLIQKSYYCYYLAGSCNYTLAGTNLTYENKIESVENAYTAITKLNANISSGVLGVSDAKKWSTDTTYINGIDVYLFD